MAPNSIRVLERCALRHEDGTVLKDAENTLIDDFNKRHERLTGQRVFDWTREGPKARQIVGVVHVSGLTIEILPKIDQDGVGTASAADCKSAQSNLLTMLSYARRLPIRYSDLAPLRLQRQSLLEAFILAFAEGLRAELCKGVDHAYMRREENLNCCKGRLLITEHIHSNLVHKERFFIGYDEFVADTPLNRIFKATCRCLLAVSRSNVAQERLRHSLLLLDEVLDTTIGLHDFDHLVWHRNNEQFDLLLKFCRFVLLGQSPAPHGGREETFSLLFDMEQLFEEFIGQFIIRHAGEIPVDDVRTMADLDVSLQGSRYPKHLLLRDAAGVLALKPDIAVYERDSNKCHLIIDTKWKRLSTDDLEDRKRSTSADLYQMFAYGERCECKDVVLLYPGVGEPVLYDVPNSQQRRIHVRMVNVSRADSRVENDVMKNRVLEDLRQAVLGAMRAREG